jgi:hypothetical protein
MAKINNRNPPPISPWPWGGRNSVSERLIDPTQLDRRKRAKKAKDSKNPALASSSLLDFIDENSYSTRTSDALRLPEPPLPRGHDADLQAYQDREHLESVGARLDQEVTIAFDRLLQRIQVAPDRLDRLKSLRKREDLMLNLVERMNQDRQEIYRRMRDEQKEKGY